MFCNNKFTLKQIDILCCFNVTLIHIDISIWYKVAFLQSKDIAAQEDVMKFVRSYSAAINLTLSELLA